MLPRGVDHIHARFRLVTPTFLGGFDHQTERLRPSAFKGALRFWWRVLSYADLATRFPDDQALLNELQAQEHRLFGSASVGDDDSSGQSRVRLRLRWAEQPQAPRPMGKSDPLVRTGSVPGAIYLGYGLIDINGKLVRSAWPAGAEFEVHLMVRSAGSAQEDDRLRRALQLLGLLGGIGARARRGYGSLAIMAYADDDSVAQLPTNERDYASRLSKLLAPCAQVEREPPFSALNAGSRLETVCKASDPMALLDHIGRQMQRYRSWGYRGRVNHQDSEQNFDHDHQWFIDALGGNLRRTAPRRTAFGLPHTYYKKDAGGAQVVPAHEDFNRRASPLLIHIHPTQHDGYIAVLCRLAGIFLPGDGQLELSAKRQTVTADMDPDWRETLDDFFDGPPPEKHADLPPYFRPRHERCRILPPRAETS